MNVAGPTVSVAGNPPVPSSAAGVLVGPSVAVGSSASNAPPAKFHETCRNLYVGNLDPRVTEYTLQEVFSGVGPVLMVKIIPDKTTYGRGNYGFVEFSTHQAAEHAMHTLNGKKVFDTDLRISWALTPSNQQKEDISNHHQVFIGDLSPEVTDQLLAKAFGAFGSLSEARVMWDPNTGKSRGYGFVSFRQKADADQAINAMNGQLLGSRTIRCNWANQKPNTGPQAVHHPQPGYEEVVMQAPAHNTTVYVGNLPFFTTREHLIAHFQQFGGIYEVRMQAERGFGFVRMETHEGAAMAIAKLQGANINGRPARCAWGKDRAIDMVNMYNPAAAMTAVPPAAVTAVPPHPAAAAFAYPPPGPYAHPVFQQPFSGPMTPDLSAVAVAAAAAAMPGPGASVSHVDPAIVAAGGFASYEAYASYYGSYGAPGGLPYLPSGVGAIPFATPPDSRPPTNGQRIPH